MKIESVNKIQIIRIRTDHFDFLKILNSFVLRTSPNGPIFVETTQTITGRIRFSSHFDSAMSDMQLEQEKEKIP